MKKYEKFKVSRTEEKLAGMFCDLCGAKTAYDDNWASGIYNIQETEVYLKEGEQYPGSGYGMEYRADICPKCFKEKLIPWLKSQGCKAEMEEWNY